MPILGITASGISGHLTPPWSPEGGYDALASITLSSNASAVTFSGIPSGYKHLQLRYTALTARPTYGHDGVLVRFNGDTGTNYSYHILRGRGSGSGDSGGGGGETSMYFDWGFGTTVNNYPSAAVFDILDYSSTNKAKTLRGLYGVDVNGAIAGYYGSVTAASGGWYYSGNPAINSISLTSANGFNIAANSTFALYGVK